MKFAEYEAHTQAACRKGVVLDPLYILAYERSAMFGHAAKKFGRSAFNACYARSRRRAMTPVVLP